MNDSPIIYAFKNMQVPLMIVGSEGQISHCNGATGDLFGYGSEELTGRPVSDVLPIETLAELNAFIEPPAIDAIVKGMIGRSKSGSPVVLGVHITAWTDREQGLQHALVLRDISAELAADQITKKELKLAHNAIKGARIGVFEYDTITDTMTVSEIWRDLLGLASSDNVDVAWESGAEGWADRLPPQS